MSSAADSVTNVAAGAGDVAAGAAKDTFSAVGNLWSDISSSMGPKIGEYLPKIVGAVIVLVLGYIIAKIIGWIVASVINKTGVGNKLATTLGNGIEKSKKGGVGAGFGNGAFWITMVFVTIACLQALGLENVSAPLNGLLDQLLGFLPKVIGAAALGAVAYLIATLSKVGLQKGLTLGEVDSRLKLAPGTLTDSLPMAAFCFIMLLFLPGIFGALQMPELSGPIKDMVNQILAFLPNLFGASLVLGVFFLIAKLASTLVTNLLGGTGFNNIPQHLGFSTANLSANPSELAGKASMVVVLLMGVSQAVKLLKLEVVNNVFNEATEFAFPVIIGVLILGVGLWLANMARKTIQSSTLANADTSGTAAFSAIMVLTGFIALKRSGLAGEIVDLGFGLALGGIALALGLAFGLGGRDAAAKFLDRRMK